MRISSHLLIYTLVSISFVYAAEHQTYGLIPLKPGEMERLEGEVEKVIRVHPNTLGKKRIARLSNNTPEETKEDSAEFTSMKVSTEEALMMIGADGELPSSIDNTLLPSFPPIGDQGQIGSCVGWGSTYYQASHELGLLNEVNNKESQERILSPKWTYNLLNDGVDGGLSVLEAYFLLASNGAPSIVELPYDTNFKSWDLNPSHWVSAIRNRMANYTLIPGLGGSGAQNLAAIKTALVNGHVLTFATYINSWVFTRIKSDPENINNDHVGEYAAFYMDGTDGGHFMTIVGYDDTLWVDVNGNGRVDAGERGAFLIANSWGTSWGNDGLIWISYDAFLANSRVVGGPRAGRVAAGAYLNSNVISVVPKAKNYEPKLVAQFSLSQVDRNQISIAGGISDLTQMIPTQSVSSYGLTNQGGALQFNGANLNSALSATFALDFTDFVASDDSLKRFYLQVGDNRSGNPTQLLSYSLVDLIHEKTVSATGLPKSYDNTTGRVYVDYDFGRALSPSAVTPTISFLSPEGGSTLTGNVNCRVDADDEVGISSVKLYVDSNFYGSFTQSGSEYVKACDTTTLRNGEHTFKALVTNTGNNTAEDSIDVVVANASDRPSFYLDAGGPTVSYMGNTWLADNGYFSGKSVVNTSVLSFANPIYQTARFGNTKYNFTVPNGRYLVTLKFAEIQFKAKKRRVFDVTVNNSKVLSKLDLVATAGFAVPYDRTFPVNVTNGAIAISLKGNTGAAIINGLQIVPAP